MHPFSLNEDEIQKVSGGGSSFYREMISAPGTPESGAISVIYLEDGTPSPFSLVDSEGGDIPLTTLAIGEEGGTVPQPDPA